MRLIQTSQGHLAQVSDEDYDRVAQHKWSVRRRELRKNGTCRWVVQRVVRRADGIRTTQFLSRFILGVTEPNMMVDHIDGNDENNQRENLRAVSKSVNQRNRYTHRAGGLFGAGLLRGNRRRPWVAQLWAGGRLTRLGYFATEQEAHDRAEAARIARDVGVELHYE
jgi:hypothetical protein